MDSTPHNNTCIIIIDWYHRFDSSTFLSTPIGQHLCPADIPIFLVFSLLVRFLSFKFFQKFQIIFKIVQYGASLPKPTRILLRWEIFQALYTHRVFGFRVLKKKAWPKWIEVYIGYGYLLFREGSVANGTPPPPQCGVT